MSMIKSSAADWAIQESRQRISGVLTRSHLLVFKTDAPLTVYVRGAKCTVTVRHHTLDQVELRATLFNAFGLQFVTDQDDAGVYVIAKRRRFVGMLSRAEFELTVPVYANLAFNLTPGTVKIEDIDGVLELPPMNPTYPMSLDHQPSAQQTLAEKSEQ